MGLEPTTTYLEDRYSNPIELTRHDEIYLGGQQAPLTMFGSTFVKG